MQKLTVLLFVLSFLLLAFAFFVVPNWADPENKQFIQIALFVLACLIDIVALRHTSRSGL